MFYCGCYLDGLLHFGAQLIKESDGFEIGTWCAIAARPVRKGLTGHEYLCDGGMARGLTPDGKKRPSRLLILPAWEIEELFGSAVAKKLLHP